MSNASVILIGTSHVVGIRLAQAARRNSGAATFDLVDQELFPKYNPIYKFVDGKTLLHEEIESDLRRALEEFAPRLIVGSLWGNQHFFMSTANSPRPFDFVLPFAPDLPLDAKAEIVPYEVMYRYIRHHFLIQDLLVPLIARLSSAPLFLLPAPPPVEDFSVLPQGSSSKQLNELVAEHGPAPASVRMKFWLLANTIHEELAAAAGVTALPIPPGTTDDAGFRRPEFYSSDWLHASPTYGARVLTQFDEILARN